MVAPILEFNTDTRIVYFPGETRWYEFTVDIDVGKVAKRSIRLHESGWNYNMDNTLPSAALTFLR